MEDRQSSEGEAMQTCADLEARRRERGETQRRRRQPSTWAQEETAQSNQDLPALWSYKVG